MRNRSPGYSASLDRKKQYSQSRLQMGPVGLARTWNGVRRVLGGTPGPAVAVPVRVGAISTGVGIASTPFRSAP